MACGALAPHSPNIDPPLVYTLVKAKIHHNMTNLTSIVFDS